MAEPLRFQERKGSRREEILRVALRLFRQRGYSNTPTRMIAEEIGTSKANVYHHFRAKDDILRAMAEPLFGRVEEFLERHEAAGSTDRRALLEEYFDLIFEDRELVALLGGDPAVLGRPGIGERAVELNDRLMRLIAGDDSGCEGRVRAGCALAALQAAVIRFPDEDPAAVRRAGLGAAHGALTG